MSNPLGDALRAAQERGTVAAAAYAALKATGKLSSHRLLTYRCERRCLLLDVINLPQGVVLHQPSYKLSPSINEVTSNESGRAKNTRDGARRWQAQTYFASEFINAALVCDHLQYRVIDRDDVQADLDAGHTEMVVTTEGRDAVR